MELEEPEERRRMIELSKSVYSSGQSQFAMVDRVWAYDPCMSDPHGHIGNGHSQKASGFSFLGQTSFGRVRCEFDPSSVNGGIRRRTRRRIWQTGLRLWWVPSEPSEIWRPPLLNVFSEHSARRVLIQNANRSRAIKRRS